MENLNSPHLITLEQVVVKNVDIQILLKFYLIQKKVLLKSLKKYILKNIIMIQFYTKTQKRK